MGSTYEVQQGETLYAISKKFDISVEELKKKNNLSDNTLSIGQRLIVK
jgi:LysM repeat protein